MTDMPSTWFLLLNNRLKKGPILRSIFNECYLILRNIAMYKTNDIGNQQ